MEFLSDEQAAAYGQFDGEPGRAELERFFFLDDADKRRVQLRRGDHNRVGFAVQLGTVRFLGTFLVDGTATPPGVVRYVADQVAPAAAVDGPMRRYVEREKTPLEHSWEIREALGYRDFASAEQATREFLQARAWTRPERPSQLFDQVVAWLRTEKVLLPGVSVLARSATLLATARTSQSNAIDDALDLFAVLMVSKLIGPAERASVAERLRTLPQLAKASATLALAARVLLELTESDDGAGAESIDPAAAWERIQAMVDREELAAAVATVE